MQITIDVPDELGRDLQRYQDRLADVVLLGIRELDAERSGHFQDEREIIAVLASQAPAELILALRPSPALQQRAGELLDQGKHRSLSLGEERELERLLTLEHLVRLAKVQAASRRIAGE